MARLAIGGVLAFFVANLACTPEAQKDASIPCDHDRECATKECLPAKNGITGACMQPACSKRCTSDDDCKGFRKSTTNEECFVCRDVGDCPHASATEEAGPLKACVDRCLAQ
jgi:hypothetical protein